MAKAGRNLLCPDAEYRFGGHAGLWVLLVSAGTAPAPLSFLAGIPEPVGGFGGARNGFAHHRSRSLHRVQRPLHPNRSFEESWDRSLASLQAHRRQLSAKSSTEDVSLNTSATPYRHDCARR